MDYQITWIDLQLPDTLSASDRQQLLDSIIGNIYTTDDELSLPDLISAQTGYTVLSINYRPTHDSYALY